MRPTTIVRHLRRRLEWGNRKVGEVNGRAYVQVRPPTEASADALAEALEATFGQIAGVRWARYNAGLGRVVIERAEGADDLEALVGAVEDLERELGLGAPFDVDSASCPGDEEPFWRAVVQIAADGLGLITGTALRLARTSPRAVEVDVAALLQVLEGIPQVRHALEARFGRAGTELAFNLANAVVAALLEGAMGPLTDIIRRVLRLRTVLAGEAAWAEQEAQLGARPESHASAPAPPSHPRPRPIPDGPIEVYTQRAVKAAVGGFGAAVLSTGSLEAAASMIFGGLPRPARLGREGFVDQLERRLTEGGAAVLVPRRLKLLDRLGALVVQGEVLSFTGETVETLIPLRGDRGALMEVTLALFDSAAPHQTQRSEGWTLTPVGDLEGEAARAAEEAESGDGPQQARALALLEGEALAALVLTEPAVPPEVATFLEAVEAAEVDLYIAHTDPDAQSWLPEGQVVSGDPALAARTVRSLQADGQTVGVVGRGGWPALAEADVGVGLLDGPTTPWRAHIIALGGLPTATLVVSSIRLAHQASRQSVYFAMAEAATSVLLSLGGLRRATTRSVMLASHATTLVSMANGVRLAYAVRPPRTRRRDPTPWHALTTDAVLERLRTSASGLGEDDASARRQPKTPPPSDAQVFRDMVIDELVNPLAPILAAGAGLSALVGSLADSALITGVVAINAVLGGVQRFRAKAAVDALDQDERPQVRVRRGEEIGAVEAADLVVGDVVILSAGEVVPADCRVMEARGLEVDESSLTGESLPVHKGAAPSYAAAVAERRSMLYEGTTVAAGEAVAVVVAVGLETEARRWEPDGGAPRSSAGVEARLETLTHLTAPVVAISGVLVILMGMLRGRPSEEVIGAGVSLAMAAVPEGLPLLATMAQLASAHRLSDMGMLVRNPRAVEALGRLDMLCADKTGTLTEGRIKLHSVSDGLSDHPAGSLPEPAEAVLAAALRATPAPNGEVLPHATDQALVEGGRDAGVPVEGGLDGWVREQELHFEPGRGFHAALGRLPGGEALLSVKGAPEALLPRCERWSRQGEGAPMTEADRAELEAHIEALAARGLRVLAVAERRFSRGPHTLGDRNVKHLTFLGVVTLADPPRPSSREAIAKLRRAGVDVMMITGDHPTTARAIARELGLSDGGAESLLTGPELEAMDEATLAARLPTVSVIARATPSDKVRIVRALQEAGRVVGMTGDGANDAPAIRMADAGIALGERSTAAARHAAPLLVTDGRIETIVNAVLEGRALWASVRDAVAILVGGNLGEIIFTVLTSVVEGRSALNARQLLLVNLLTDGLPALSIAVRPPADTTPEHLMQEGPDRSLGRSLNRDIAWRAALTSASAGGAWLVARLTMPPRKADTVGLLALVGGQLGQTLVLGWRSPTVLAASLGSLAVLVAIVETPGLSHFFGCQPLGPFALGQAGIATGLTTLAGIALPPLAERLSPTIEGHPLVQRVLQSQTLAAARRAVESMFEED